jgi:sugar lactone lactonase YvrE
MKNLMKSSGILALALMYLFSTTCFSEVYVETYARVNGGDGLEFDPTGNLYSANYATGHIRKITHDKNISDIIGASNLGPAGMKFDANGNMFVAMHNANTIQKIQTNGTRTDYATGLQGPIGLDWDSQENLYVANFYGNPTISKILPGGIRTAFVNITGVTSASSVAVDDDDNVYLVRYNSGDIIKVTPSGEVSVFASTGASGFGFIVYGNGRFYLSENDIHRVVVMNLQGEWEVYAGSGTSGNGNGPAASASFDRPNGVAISNDGRSVLIAEQAQLSLRRIFEADPTIDLIRPYFTSLASSLVTEGDNYSYQMVAVDPNGDNLNYELITAPNWLSFDGDDRLNGLPSAEDVGRFEVVVSATDNSGLERVEQFFSITVTKLQEPKDPGSSGGGTLSYGFVVCLFLLGRMNTRKN